MVLFGWVWWDIDFVGGRENVGQTFSKTDQQIQYDIQLNIRHDAHVIISDSSIEQLVKATACIYCIQLTFCYVIVLPV